MSAIVVVVIVALMATAVPDIVAVTAAAVIALDMPVVMEEHYLIERG